MDDVMQAFRREFQQLGVIEQWTTDISHEIKNYELEMRRFQGILMPLIGLSIFSVPIIIIICLGYFVGNANSTDKLYAFYVIVLCFGLILSFALGLPTYILTLWLVKEEVFRSHHCKCHHHCHMHFGYEGPRDNISKSFWIMMRNFLVSFFVIIIEWCGVRAFLCDLCLKNGKKTYEGCHCYHGYYDRFVPGNIPTDNSEEQESEEEEGSEEQQDSDPLLSSEDIQSENETNTDYSTGNSV